MMGEEGPHLNIRQSDKRDIAQLIRMRFDFTAEYKEIEADLFKPYYEESLPFFEQMMIDDNWRIWVAEDEGRIVSHVFVQIIETIPRPGRKRSPYGYVTNVYTVPAYRSKGIGGMIMQEIKDWSHKHGLTFLMVWPSEASVEFYERHGFNRNEEILELPL